MPSVVKMLLFFSSALATVISVGLLGYGMSAQWATITMKCAREGSGNFNGTAVITMGLFSGVLDRSFCPSFGKIESFDGKSVNSGDPKTVTSLGGDKMHFTLC